MGWVRAVYSAQDSADTLLAERCSAMLVCYLRHGDKMSETYFGQRPRLRGYGPSYGLLDMTVHGRQETWKDSPAGWPK